MPPRNRPPGRLVYSTELGRTCPSCRESLATCTCRAQANRIIGDGNVRVGRESKGRRGKSVTIITGLPLPSGELAALATLLKRSCGTGGTVKEGIIEIQGDHRDHIAEILREHGYTVKRSGA